MAYAEFDLKTVVQKFDLTLDENSDLFANVEPIDPSEFLRAWLDRFASIALEVNSEKARREFIIAPILAETKVRSENMVEVLPGVTFDRRPSAGAERFLRLSHRAFARSPLHPRRRSSRSSRPRKKI